MIPKFIHLLLLCFVTESLLFGCIPSNGKPPCSLDKLLLNIQDLPGDEWEEIGSRSYRDAATKIGSERIGTSFSTPTHGIANEEVYLFKNIENARNGYNKLSDNWFHLEPYDTTWTKLEIPDDYAIHTADYRLECSVRANQINRTCFYAFRFEKLVILFQTDMLIITNEDLFKIIDLLDQKARVCSDAE